MESFGYAKDSGSGREESAVGPNIGDGDIDKVSCWQ